MLLSNVQTVASVTHEDCAITGLRGKGQKPGASSPVPGCAVNPWKDPEKSLDLQHLVLSVLSRDGGLC